MCFKRPDKIINSMEYIVDCFMNYNKPSSANSGGSDMGKGGGVSLPRLNSANGSKYKDQESDGG